MFSLTRFVLLPFSLFLSHVEIAVWGVIWLIQAIIFFALGVIVGLVAFKVGSRPSSFNFAYRHIAISCGAENTIVTLSSRSRLVFGSIIDVPQLSRSNTYYFWSRGIGSVNTDFLYLS